MAENETCANCSRPIGKLETAHIWRESVVCNECLGRLRNAEIGYATPAPPAASAATDDDRAEFVREIRRPHGSRKKRDQDSAQAVGCLIMLLGVILLCVFWPVGVVVLLIGFILMAANTRLW